MPQTKAETPQPNHTLTGRLNLQTLISKRLANLTGDRVNRALVGLTQLENARHIRLHGRTQRRAKWEGNGNDLHSVCNVFAEVVQISCRWPGPRWHVWKDGFRRGRTDTVAHSARVAATLPSGRKVGSTPSWAKGVACRAKSASTRPA